MTIHHWFIPTKKNKFHPHALRPVGLIVFLALFVSIPFLYNVTSAKSAQVLGYATSISVGQIAALTNQERANNGLPALTLDTQLSNAAAAKAQHMFANNYWAHVAPDGTTPWSFISAAGDSYSVAGENLAKDFNTSSGVVAGWMGSSTHRANILSTSYGDAGFAVVNGTLQGTETTLVVAMYGARVVAPAPAPAAPPLVVATSTQPQGEVEGATTLLPLRVYNSMNWGQKASLALLSVLMLLFIMKHTLVWRQQRRGFRHIWLRAHPLGQVAVLGSVFVITMLGSIGAIL